MQFEQLVSGLCRRVVRREQSVERQLAPRAVATPIDPDGSAIPLEWKATVQVGSPAFQKTDKTPAGSLCVTAEDQCVASWRTQVLLEPGQYRFSGRVKVTDLESAEGDPKSGASLRVSRRNPPRRLSGTTDWTTLSCDFQVQDHPSPVELVCEFRGIKGKACFDRDSLQ